MYWNVGKFLSDESKGKEYGDLYIDSVANFIQGEFSGIKGFNRCGLYRMKQFYETYCDNEIVSPLVTQSDCRRTRFCVMQKSSSSSCL